MLTKGTQILNLTSPACALTPTWASWTMKERAPTHPGRCRAEPGRPGPASRTTTTSHHVLDYRKVRQIIIDECTAEHVNLLESLIGKLAQRLMQLPGVLGVRVKIAKLEIFDDCEVAIRVETGQW